MWSEWDCYGKGRYVIQRTERAGAGGAGSLDDQTSSRDSLDELTRIIVSSMRMRVLAALLLSASFFYSATIVAQTTEPVQKAVDDPRIKEAMARVEEHRSRVLELWKKLAVTSAPSGHEDERAAIVMDELRKFGYEDAYRDSAGNLISAPVPSGSRIVAFVAHMDTVVRPGVEVTVTEGKNERGKLIWTGPGVGDNTSGVVALLEVARALHEANYRPTRPLIFVFSVNEEGGGSSEGIRRFIKEHTSQISAFISTDGSPIDEVGGIADNGVGRYALKPVFTGPGVHTSESTGMPSTIRAAALAIARLYQIEVPQSPLEKRSWLNIGVIQGGTVPSAMAESTTFSVDLRSNDVATGQALQEQARAIIEQAAREVGVKVKIPPSRRDPLFLNTPEQKHLVETLWSSYRAIGITPQKGKIGSSDFVFALAQGIPAVGVGLTNIRRMHSPEEEAEVDALFSGIRAVLVAAGALTQ